MLNFPKPDFLSNIGGNLTFMFIPNISVVSIPPNIDFVINSPIPLKPDQSWYNGYASPKSLAFLEKDENNGSDDYFSIIISGFYPFLNPVAISRFSKMQKYRFLVLCLDNNKQLRLAGTLENPLKFSYSLATGASAPNRNGISFSFSGDVLTPSPFISRDHPLYKIHYPAVD